MVFKVWTSLLVLILVVTVVRPYSTWNLKSSKFHSISLRSLSWTSGAPDLEYQVRRGIQQRNWKTVKEHLQSLNSTTLLSNRNIVYVITETCRRTENYDEILPLLRSLNTELKFLEDDILPLMKSCVNNAKQMQIIQSMINFFHEKGIVFSARVYTTLLKGYGKQRNEKMVDTILDFCITKGVKPDSFFFNAVVNGYLKCKNYYQGLKLMATSLPEIKTIFTKAFDRYTTKSPTTHLISNTVAKRIEYLSNVNTVTLYGVNTFLAGLKPLFMEKLVNIHQVLAFLSVVSENYGISNYDEITYNTLIDLASTTNDLSMTETMLQQVKTSLGTEAYTSLLSLMGRQGKIEKALETLDSMMNNNILVNEYTLTSVMTSLIQQNSLKQAKDILREENKYHRYLIQSVTSLPERKRLEAELRSAYISGICQFGIQTLDTIPKREYNMTSSISLKNIAYQLSLEALLQLLEMERMQLFPSIVAINSLTNFILQLYQPSKVIEILLLLQYYQKQNGLLFDKYTYSILLTRLGKLSLNQCVIRFFSTLTSNTDPSNKASERLPIDISMINSFLKSFEYSGQYAEGIVYSYNFLLPSSQDNSRRIATTVSPVILPNSVIPNIRTFNSILTLLEKYLILKYRPLDDLKASTSSNKLLDGKTEHGISLEDAITLQSYFNNNNNTLSSQILLTQFKNTLTNSSLSQLFKEIRLHDLLYRMNPNILDEISHTSKKQNSKSEHDEWIKEMTFDTIFYEFYRQMRLNYQITIDVKIVNKINHLFYLINQRQSAWFNTVTRFFIHDDIHTPDQIVSRKTSRFIFEDLVLQGFDPKMLTHLLYACEYSRNKNEQWKNPKYLQEFRSNRESYRIFLKHEWNHIDSGWRIF